MNKTEIENKGLDQDFFEFLCNRYAGHHPFMDTLGIKPIYLGKGTACMQMCPAPNLSSDGGRVQGGIIATLADTVMAAAIITATGRFYRTVDLNMNYLAPCYEETDLIAEAHVIHAGKTMALIEGSLFNKEGKLIAKSRGTFIGDNKYPPIWEF